MKTLYVSDLDGTLLGPDQRLSDFTARTLNRLIGDGLCFSYATARSISSASLVARGLTSELPVIVYNGAFTMRAGTDEVVDSAYFSAGDAADILHSLIAAGTYPLVYARIDGRERVSYVKGRESEGDRAYFDSRPGDARFRPVASEEELIMGDVFYFTSIDSERALTQVHSAFRADPRVSCVFQADIYRPHEHWFELMPSRATKGNAILRLKALLGCDRVVCFGDGLNDLPMFAIADECYAVDNAADALKRVATGVIASNRDDGVAHFLEELTRHS